MPRVMIVVFSLAVFPSHACGMTITKGDTAPSTSDLLLAFDTDGAASQTFFPMARGGGTSGVGGGETAFGQTFQFDTDVLLDKITLKARITQDVSGVPLLLWFGTGYTGPTSSGLSSLIIEPESDLPTGMGASGDVWYLTLDIEDQSLVANQTYALMPRFAAGGSGGVHPEMEVGFMGAYSYDGGAAFTFDGGFGYRTILNNDMVFFLHGEVTPEPGTGDFDGDGYLTVKDIDMLTTEVLTGDDTPRFDLDDDSLVNEQDQRIWIKDLKYTWFGDADLNGEFNSSDMVQVFSAGKYETDEGAGWAEGDWNCTGAFDSSDMVAAFADDGYEKGARTGLAVVPEPTSIALLAIGLIGVAVCRWMVR